MNFVWHEWAGRPTANPRRPDGPGTLHGAPKTSCAVSQSIIISAAISSKSGRGRVTKPRNKSSK